MNQLEDGRKVICEFMSGKFDSTQQRQCIIMRELHAALFCLRKWRHLIIRSKIELQTDSMTVSWLLKSPNVSDKLLRFAQEFTDYDLVITQISGASNRLADLTIRGVIDPDITENLPCKIDSLC